MNAIELYQRKVTIHIYSNSISKSLQFPKEEDIRVSNMSVYMERIVFINMSF